MRYKHLHKKGAYYYYVRYGQWIPLRTTDEAQALRLWAELEASPGRMAAVKAEGPRALVMTFDNLSADFLRDMRRRAVPTNTMRAYERAIDGLKQAFGSLPLQHVDRPALMRYHSLMADRPAEANLHMRVASVVMSYARDRGLIETNPADRLRKYKQHRHRLTLTVPILFREIFPVADLQLQRAVMLAFHLVQHEGEIRRLKWTDIDADHNRISFQRQKTGAVISIDYTANTTLRLFLDELRAARKDLVPWLIHHNGRPYSTFSPMWRAAQERAGYEPGTFPFRAIRHLANTMLKDGGLGADKRRMMTGHMSAATNEIYTHATGGETIQAGRILGEAMNGTK